MLNSKLATPLLLLILFTAFIGSFMQYKEADKDSFSRSPASVNRFEGTLVHRVQEGPFEVRK